jgi:hypothetical protein
MMKAKIFAILVGAVVVTTGCVKTVSDTHTASVSFARDRVEGRYPRSVDQVYQAAFAVINKNGVVVTEYIPHDTSNNVRSFQAKVSECNVWVRVEADADAKTTLITVQARTKWGATNLDLAIELEKEVALQLQSQSGSGSGS